MAAAIVNPLLEAEPFEEASEGPRSPVSERDMQIYYEEQERQDMQRRLSKSWRRSFKRSTSGKNMGSTGSKATSEPDSEAYGTGQEDSIDDHPSSLQPTDSAPPTPGPAITHRKPLAGRPSESGLTSRMPPPPPVVRDQSHIPPHMRRYEIYQPPSFVARAPPRYYNFHLLSASAKERLQRELALSYTQGRLPSLVSSGSVFSGVGSGTAGGSVRSSLSVRRPSMLAAVSSAHFGGSAGYAGLETITASPASTAAPLGSPSLDPMSALNAGPAANHRLSTWLKRPPLALARQCNLSRQTQPISWTVQTPLAGHGIIPVRTTPEKWSWDEEQEIQVFQIVDLPTLVQSPVRLPGPKKVLLPSPSRHLPSTLQTLNRHYPTPLVHPTY
ncbi:hypothetical protein B0J17DRAFT_102705 [Rhizoctonia solani]|nr:hypothetical protein B0J17DRAFT_102705 [Rhizoctonia solani]